MDDFYNLPDTADRPSYSQLTIANALLQYNSKSGGVVAWLKANATAVYITAGALVVLAIVGGTRR